MFIQSPPALEELCCWQATIMCLKIMYFSTAALIWGFGHFFLTFVLSVVFYFVRILRIWILLRQAKLLKNFTRSLLQILKNLHVQDIPSESITPYLFNSKPCEKLFSVTRWIKFTYFTFIFSTKDVLHGIDCTKIMNKVRNHITSHLADNRNLGGHADMRFYIFTRKVTFLISVNKYWH